MGALLPPRRRRVHRALGRLARELAGAGASLTLEAPGMAPLAVGPRAGAARVVLRSEAALACVARRDLLGLAEAYLDGGIDVAGDFRQVVQVTEVLAPDPTQLERLRQGLRLLRGGRRTLQRQAVAFHYDRPAGFFLPWLERWRSYSHGLYATPEDPPEEAQARKLQRAVDALGLEPGMHVFDMGCGWGSFLEYAGLRGIRVHGITLSEEQLRFVESLIRAKGLPCSVERVDFLDHRPRRPYDGAVFMGSLEHFPHYRRAARFLSRHLTPRARVWADFCSERTGSGFGAFMARHVFPGARYVRVPELLAALGEAGFLAHELVEDTRSYGFTCRDWADALEREHKALAERFGEREVRTFQVFLRASEHFFAANRTQAYHLVAGREPRL